MMRLRYARTAVGRTLSTAIGLRTQVLLTGLCVLVGAADAIALEPKDPELVCQRISTTSGEAECLRAIEGLYVDRLAAAACDRIPSNDATIQCMRAIAGRRISRALTLSCDAVPTAWETVRCFSQDMSSMDQAPGSYSDGYGGRGPGRGHYRPHERPGGCNMYGCFRNGGGCNMYGCWNAPGGTCNMYGCSDYGACTMHGCPPR